MPICAAAEGACGACYDHSSLPRPGVVCCGRGREGANGGRREEEEERDLVLTLFPPALSGGRGGGYSLHGGQRDWLSRGSGEEKAAEAFAPGCWCWGCCEKLLRWRRATVMQECDEISDTPDTSVPSPLRAREGRIRV